MDKLRIITALCLAFSILCLPNAGAQEVVMTTGEKFTTSKVWEENGDIRFNMQGIVVKVKKEEVASIIRSDSATSFSAQENPPPETNQPPASGRAFGRQVAKTVPSHATAPDDGGTSLPGIAWMMRPGEIPGLVLVQTDPAFGGVDQYQCPGQPLVLGDADLDGRVYGFWQTRLYSVMLWAQGRSGYEALKQELFSRFGNGVRSNRRVDCYVWDGRQTQRMLEYDPDLNTAIFIMRSKILDQRMRQRYPRQ